jgi:hypothetical protein|nr:MAG TPA: hypothetical protein [Caudoviricetes sp.]
MIDINEYFNPYELELIRCYPDEGLDVNSDKFHRDSRIYNDLINKGILYNEYPDRFNNRNYTLCRMTYAGCFLQVLIVQKAEHQRELKRYQREIYDEVYLKGYNEAVEKMGFAMAEMIASHIGEPSCK